VNAAAGPGPWPWSGAEPRFLASGRQALAWLVAAVLPPRPRVLCPACICASVPAGLRAAGAEPVFYAQDDELVPRWGTLGDADALLLVHPLGRRLPCGPVRALRRRRPEVTVIEDISHTLLNRPPAAALGAAGGADFAVASLRKLLPLPDGGVAVAWRGGRLPAGPAAVPAPSAVVRKRLAADASAEDDLDAWSGPPEPIWQGTLARLRDLDPAGLRRARRARYRALAAALDGSDGVVPFWRALPGGVAPLAYPVRCRNRHDLRRRLQVAGVAAEPYWPVPEPARAAAGLSGRLLAGTLLLVSCDPARGCLDNIRVRH
jgi:hypothetical protein